MLGFLRARGRRAGERGSILLLTVGGMAALYGFVALSVDVGQMMSTRRLLQNAADAGVHAGVLTLPDDSINARTAAQSWIQKNKIQPGEITDISFSRTYTDNDTIAVTVQRRQNSTFGKVVNFSGATINARAKAVIGSIAGAMGVFPFGLLDLNGPGTPGFGYAFGEHVVLREAPSNYFGPGNYGFLRVDTSGGSSIRSTLENDGSTRWIDTGMTLDTQTGQATGPVTQGLDTWASNHGDAWNSGSVCDDWDTAHSIQDGIVVVKPQCKYRIVLIPIIDQWTNGTSGQVTVLGFAQMYLAQWTPSDGKRLDAVFIEGSVSFPKVRFGAANDYGTRIPKIIE